MEAIYQDGTYLSNHAGWHLEDSPWKAEQIYEIIRRNQVSFDHAVEVGCGAGGVTYELSRKFPNSKFLGFEISPQASKFWNYSKSENLQIQLGNFLETSDIYDLLLLIDVFEHVPDYLGFLRSLSTRSKYFVFNIPLDMHLTGLILDHQIHARNKYGHLHYFSKATALETLADAGYNVIDFFYAPGFMGAPAESALKTWKQKVMYPLRWSTYKIAPGLSAKLFGGISLMVLATS